MSNAFIWKLAIHPCKVKLINLSNETKILKRPSVAGVIIYFSELKKKNFKVTDQKYPRHVTKSLLTVTKGNFQFNVKRRFIYFFFSVYSRSFFFFFRWIDKAEKNTPLMLNCKGKKKKNVWCIKVIRAYFHPSFNDSAIMDWNILRIQASYI